MYKLTIDELHGTFTTNDMRMRHVETTKREVTFKATKWEKVEETTSILEETNEEEVNFIRKFRRGFRKYKDKFTH